MTTVVRKTDSAAWARLEGMIKALDGIELNVGWFSTDRYKSGVPVAFVATAHEFGSSSTNLPPRPTMRPTIQREEANWRRFIDQEARKILAGTLTVEDMFEALGLNVAGEIARSITELTTPELAESTILSKLRKLADSGTVGAVDKPLVETGLMLASVSYAVGDNSPKRWGG